MVMTFLFRSGSLRDKFAWILRATYTHSKNLATFVLMYKTLMAIMRRVEGGKCNVHPFISAFIGGYFVFGTHDKINEQVSCEIFRFYQENVNIYFCLDRLYSICCRELQWPLRNLLLKKVISASQISKFGLGLLLLFGDRFCGFSNSIGID